MARKRRRFKHLKAGFSAEALTAARFRAYARRADREGLPNLARHWRQLAIAKDELAIQQLEEYGAIRGGLHDLEEAIRAEEKENSDFYPKLLSESDEVDHHLIQRILDSQQQHLAWMKALQGALTAARGDVEAPVDGGANPKT